MESSCVAVDDGRRGLVSQLECGDIGGTWDKTADEMKEDYGASILNALSSQHGLFGNHKFNGLTSVFSQERLIGCDDLMKQNERGDPL